MTERYSRRKFLALTGTVSGVALAGCSSSSGDSDGNGGDPTEESTPTEESGGNGGSGSWTEASTVEMTDQLVFEPKRIQVESGTTVTWENVGAVGHTVTAYEDAIPDGAAYFASGGFDAEQAAVDGYNSDMAGNIPEGETYEHTFETTGTYEYYCIPHEMSGMVGYVKVV